MLFIIWNNKNQGEFISKKMWVVDEKMEMHLFYMENMEN